MPSGGILATVWFMALWPISGFAQTPYGVSGLVQRVDGAQFHNCAQVEAIALQARERIRDYAYNLELLPQSPTSAFFAFPSESGAAVRMKWLAGYHPERSPIASFYSVGGAYTFRCRDDQNRLMESSGPEGDPLRLKLGTGEAVISHFSMSGKQIAYVMVIIDVALDSLDGEELLAEVTRRLNARVVFLFVRNDPWFFDYAPDSLPFLFTDKVKRLTEAEYAATETIVCYSDQRCKVVSSLQ